MADRIALITGAGGFIGSHLVETARAAGYSVRAFVHYNSSNTRGWLSEVADLTGIDIVAGDIRDYDSVLAAAEGCDAVFHLAALIGIPYSYISPLAYVKTNIEGTYNILEAARRLRVPNVLITSTSETYGTAQYVPIDEKHPAVGQSPYAATKIGADQLALSYHRSFGLPVKVVRPFNTYGPRQSARAIIPTVATQILAGKRRLDLGNVAPTRDLTFVEDTAAAFLAIAERPECVGMATNVGMNAEISVGALVEKISHILDARVEINSDLRRVRPAESEVERLCCDNGRIRQLTHWRPQWDLDRGLRRTIEWIRQHQAIYRAEVYNV
jgi:dTDP-glucose 4,6-dehydratase